MVYEERSKLHHAVAPILAIQTNTKGKFVMLKKFTKALNSMHWWSTKYLVVSVLILEKRLDHYTKC